MKKIFNMGLIREIQANLTVYAAVLVAGMAMGFSAIAIPGIEGESNGGQPNLTSFISPIQADREMLSWFASSINIGQIFGGIIGGVMAGLYGPKRTILLGSLPNLVGWIIIAVSPNIYLLILGRLLNGVGGSFNLANCSMLVAQYTSNARRGIFLSMFTLMSSSGILFIYIAGATLHWRLAICVPIAIQVVQVSLMLLLPESPIWLLGHRGIKETRLALQWLRGCGDVERELDELRLTQEKQDKKLTLVQALKNFKRKDVYKPFLLVLSNMVLNMFTGSFAIVFYAVDIFKSSGVAIDNYLAAIIMAIVRLAASVCGIFIISKVPRVKLAFTSMLFIFLSLGLLGFTLYCQHVEYSFPGVNIIPLVCIFVYMSSFGSGCGPLSWVWVGEFIPPEYKVLSGITTSLATGSVFLVTKLFPNLISLLNMHGTFWLFCAVSLLNCVLYLTVYPETKDLSMLQIKEMFQGTSRDRDPEVNEGFDASLEGVSEPPVVVQKTSSKLS